MSLVILCLVLVIISEYQQITARPIPKEKKDPDFYQSKEWRELRQRVFAVWGRDCQRCNRNIEPMTIDHILPRSIPAYRHLELSFANQQVLCFPCNREKSNTDYTDYRDIERILTSETHA